MSKLQELLDHYCPNGVEKKTLKVVSLMQRGTSITKSKAHVGCYPVISGGREPAFYCDSYNRDGETITVAGSGAGAGYVQYFDEPLFANDCFTVKGLDGVSTKYLYYCLTWMQGRISGAKKGGGVPHVHISDIDGFEVPVPPIEVQREIVRILDSFTELTTELTTELAARRKQYEYYRDTLLTFPMPNEALSTDTVKWLRIMDCCNIRRGKVISKDYIRDNEGKYPVYSSQTENNGVLGSISDYMYDGEYLTWTTDGANAGTVFYRSGRFNITNVCGLLEPDTEIVNTRYLCFVLNMLAKKHVKYGMGNPKLMSNAMSAIKVPIPPMEEQRRIVSILDRFDVICNDLTSGLPAEIAARQKQYEYYRDKLLSFR